MFCSGPCFIQFAAQVGQIVLIIWNKSLKEIVEDAVREASPVVADSRFYLVS